MPGREKTGRTLEEEEMRLTTTKTSSHPVRGWYRYRPKWERPGAYPPMGLLHIITPAAIPQQQWRGSVSFCGSRLPPRFSREREGEKRDPFVLSSWKKLKRSGTLLTRKQFVERYLHLDGSLRRSLTVTVTVSESLPRRRGRGSGRSPHRIGDDAAIPPLDDTPQQFVEPSLASQDLERRDEVRSGPEREIGGFEPAARRGG